MRNFPIEKHWRNQICPKFKASGNQLSIRSFDFAMFESMKLIHIMVWIVWIWAAVEVFSLGCCWRWKLLATQSIVSSSTRGRFIIHLMIWQTFFIILSQQIILTSSTTFNAPHSMQLMVTYNNNRLKSCNVAIKNW